MIASSTIPILAKVASFTEARHDVLAGNVANMDTPGYQVRDLSVEKFQERLREAIEARENYRSEPSPGMPQEDPDEAMRRVDDSMTGMLFHDGSNVGMEQQVLEISKNHYMHNVAISILSSQFRLLQTAISERV